MRRLTTLVLGIVLAVCGGLAGGTELPNPTPSEIVGGAAHLTARAEIIDTVNAIGIFSDLRQWDRVKTLFADEVVWDDTSYKAAVTGGDGGTPERMTSEEIVESWRTTLSGYQRTQHLITNHLVTVEGDTAHCLSQVFASHYLPNAQGGDYWIVAGHYDHELIRTAQGWKVTLMRFNYGFQLGNTELSDLAIESFKTRHP